MTRKWWLLPTIGVGLLLGAEPAAEYAQAIRATANMVNERAAQQEVRKHGLNLLNVTWEDTGRFKNSAVGPNISDMTIQVQHANRLTCMPVLRYPNFSDKTGDLPFDQFFLPVGNEQGRALTYVSLREYLGNFRAYLHKPTSWAGDHTSLLADRDSHALVSAQACFLPVPAQAKAEFNPVLFNYQSGKGNPAVLAIVATREGTSATIIDNVRDGFNEQGVWGQRLFFNKNGQRASLTGQRLSEFHREPPVGQPDAPPQAAGQAGLNLVLLIQVPLKHKERKMPAEAAFLGSAPMPAAPQSKARKGDVEEAVIGHGKVEGAFTEMDNLPIERDPRFPVRVTVQFYQATSNGVLNPSDVPRLAEQIKKVYDRADYVGSLVTDGTTRRPTEHTGPKVQPPSWWADFWQKHEAETGRSRADVLAELRKVPGAGWQLRTESELAEQASKLPKRR
jgi:hypothetical protein